MENQRVATIPLAWIEDENIDFDFREWVENNFMIARSVYNQDFKFSPKEKKQAQRIFDSKKSLFLKTFGKENGEYIINALACLICAINNQITANSDHALYLDIIDRYNRLWKEYAFKNIAEINWEEIEIIRQSYFENPVSKITNTDPALIGKIVNLDTPLALQLKDKINEIPTLTDYVEEIITTTYLFFQSKKFPHPGAIVTQLLLEVGLDGYADSNNIRNHVNRGMKKLHLLQNNQSHQKL
jgi:hypothetical protein